jgi:hypothetical protein
VACPRLNRSSERLRVACGALVTRLRPSGRASGVTQALEQAIAVGRCRGIRRRSADVFSSLGRTLLPACNDAMAMRRPGGVRRILRGAEAR